MFSIFVQNIVYISIPRYDGTDQMKGMHGYDNADSDMRAIFLASGPGTYNVIYILQQIQLKNISFICFPFPYRVRGYYKVQVRSLTYNSICRERQLQLVMESKAIFSFGSMISKYKLSNYSVSPQYPRMYIQPSLFHILLFSIILEVVSVVYNFPGFKKNFVSPPFYNVELYQLMCNILGVNPNPHNGTWSKVSPMLLKAEPERSDHTIMQEL